MYRFALQNGFYIKLITIFKEYVDSYQHYVERNSKCNIRDFARININYAKKNNSKQKIINMLNKGFDTCSIKSPNIQYWSNKIFATHGTNEHTVNRLTIELWESYNIQKRHIYAVDGSITRIHTKDSFGSITLSMLCDVETSIIYDCGIGYNTNEREAIIRQITLYVNIYDICVMDRGYFGEEFVNIINQQCFFVIRMKLNLKIVKEFLEKNVASSTVVILGKTYRLVRYKVDKSTKDIVCNYYNSSKDGTIADDLSPEYVLITNIMDENTSKIAQYYRMRWQVEVSIKDMKTNYDVNRLYVANYTQTPERLNNIIQSRLCMICYLYNLSRMIEILTIQMTKRYIQFGNHFEKQGTSMKYNFTTIADLCIDNLSDAIKHNEYDPNIITKIQNYIFENNCVSKIPKKRKRESNHVKKKRGRYKSITTIYDHDFSEHLHAPQKTYSLTDLYNSIPIEPL